MLLRGESGTGKELIAHAIHYNSARAKKPFIKVSCAALPHDLIESELFGYEKGAFTGAQATKKGRFELAEGGTLFLDEVGELNLSTQVKLLRVLQEREFERLGSTETIRANIRLVAATNKDLEKAILAGEFREDLYYRLNVFAIFVPPLRERKPDVLLLADHFVEKFAREHGKKVKRISTPAIDMLASYHWPGNVRELANAIERRRRSLRRPGHPRAPPAAHAPDGRGLRHGTNELAEGFAGGIREGRAAGRPQERTREPGEGGAAPVHDRADLQLPCAALRNRLAPLQGLTHDENTDLSW